MADKPEMKLSEHIDSNYFVSIRGQYQQLRALVAGLEAELVGYNSLRQIVGQGFHDTLDDLMKDNAALQKQVEMLPGIKIADDTVWLVFPFATISIDAIGSLRGPIVKKNLRAWRDTILEAGCD